MVHVSIKSVDARHKLVRARYVQQKDFLQFVAKVSEGTRQMRTVTANNRPKKYHTADKGCEYLRRCSKIQELLK
jgi:hypothetical protein